MHRFEEYAMNTNAHSAASLFFIKPSHPAYRAWLRQVIATRKENRPESVPDPQFFVSRWVERVLSAELWQPLDLQAERILMWRERNCFGHSALRFRELDCVGRPASEPLLAGEIKSSWSKESFDHGVGQLKKSLALLARNGIAAKGLLILLDTRAVNSGAGYLAGDSIKELAGLKGIQVMDGWAGISTSDAAISLRLLDATECERLIGLYGPPECRNLCSA